MTATINTALSGLNAASTRLSVSANNIANAFSTSSDDNGQVTNTPYTPQRVDQISLSSGGVEAQVSNVTPATTAVPNGQGGTTQEPNVDLTNELMQVNTASYDYKANLKVVQSQDQLFQSLLDIVS